mgnify:CR=1 FL=1|jgi:hypothetical protein
MLNLSKGQKIDLTKGRNVNAITFELSWHSLYEKNDYAYWVAIAHIDFTSPSEMKVSHVERYSRRHFERSPVLYADGAFRMNVGEEEFKDW